MHGFVGARRRSAVDLRPAWATRYDVVVVGAGTGGYSAALRAAELGKRVAIVDRDERLGGTCLFRGCIPTKALLRSAAVMDTVEPASTWGIKAAGEPDWAAVRAFEDADRRQVGEGRHRASSSRAGSTSTQGPRTLLPGPAVEVDGSPRRDRHRPRHRFAPRLLPGVEVGERIITSDEALRADRIPASAVVIGAGAVGLEFASIYRSFGAEVTLLEALPRPRPAGRRGSVDGGRAGVPQARDHGAAGRLRHRDRRDRDGVDGHLRPTARRTTIDAPTSA